MAMGATGTAGSLWEAFTSQTYKALPSAGTFIYYDPRTGRFLTRDTQPGIPGEPLSLNPYLYVADNPVNRADPSGHDFSLASTLVASAESLRVRGQDALNARRGLITAKKVGLTATRVLGGLMAIEAVVEDVGNHFRAHLVSGQGCDFWPRIKNVTLKYG